MSDNYELKLTAELDYGKDIGRHRYTVERKYSDLDIYEFLEVLKSLTLSVGYAEQNWKHAIINMADEYMAEVRSEDRSDIILENVDWDENTEYMVTHDHEHHVETGTRGCPVTGSHKTNMNQYTDFHGNPRHVTQEQC